MKKIRITVLYYRYLIVSESMMTPMWVLFIIVLLFAVIPLPANVLFVFYGVSVVSCLAVLMVAITKKKYWKRLPSVVMILLLFLTGVSVASTKLILVSVESGVTFPLLPVLQTQFFEDIYIAVCLTVAVLWFLSRVHRRNAELAARYTLDSSLNRISIIERREISGEFTKDQAIQEKAALYNEFQFYSEMDGSSRMIYKCVVYLSINYMVTLISGTLIGTFVYKMIWHEALAIVSSPAGYSLCFCIISCILLMSAACVQVAPLVKLTRVYREPYE